MISILIILFLSPTFHIIMCDERIKYAAVIFRHGDRTPVDLYPTDPWRNESLWPVKFGELTNIGKMQHYLFGQWMRKRYSHLLSEEFDPTEIYIRSTDVDRTLMSAQANLAGMYPPKGNSVWNSLLMWQPIPVHTVPEHDDEVLAMKKPCQAYNQEFNKVITSKEYKERLSKYQKLMNYLSAYTGMKVKDYYDIITIYTDLSIEKLYNFTLPEWTHSVFPDQLKEPSGYSFRIDTYNTLMSRLKIGPLMKLITNHMINAIDENTNAVEKKNHLKLSIFSGHDLTVGSVLNGLGMYDGVCPVYTSAVFFEIIEDESEDNTTEYFVRISYRNSTGIQEPYVLNIPYCGELCPFDRFVKLYDNIINVNWEHDCGFKYPPLALSLCVGLLLFATIYFAHKIHFMRVTRNYRSNMVYSNINELKPDTEIPIKAV